MWGSELGLHQGSWSQLSDSKSSTNPLLSVPAPLPFWPDLPGVPQPTCVATSAAASLGPCCLWVFYPVHPSALSAFQHFVESLGTDTHSHVCVKVLRHKLMSVEDHRLLGTLLWCLWKSSSGLPTIQFPGKWADSLYAGEGNTWVRKGVNCAENRKCIKDQKSPELNDKAFEALSFVRCTNRLCLWRSRDTNSSGNRASPRCSVTAGGQFTIHYLFSRSIINLKPIFPTSLGISY